MGLKQTLDQQARRQRDFVTISANKTLTPHDMEAGVVKCTKTGSGQTITLPNIDGPPFLIVAAGRQTVTVSGLYDTSTNAATNAITTKLAGLCHRIKGLGWFCISDVATS